MTIEEFRANPVIAGFGRETPPDVGSIETLAFPSEDGSELRLKIYYPRGYDKHSDEHTSGLPCYFDVHGGGKRRPTQEETRRCHAICDFRHPLSLLRFVQALSSESQTMTGLSARMSRPR